jgi:phage baseplate assembly protein gpV
MQGLLNAMRLQAMLAGEGRISMRLGTVRGYDSKNHCAKVIIQPENIESGWLPIASQWVGNGWGIFAPPTDGDVVMVTCQEDDFNAGIISLRLFNDGARPLDVPSGELWLVHQSGSCLKFHNDGTVELTSHGALTVKAPSMTLQNAGSALKKLVNETFLTLFDGHQHPDPVSGLTGTPTTPSGTGHKTSIVQAE